MLSCLLCSRLQEKRMRSLPNLHLPVLKKGNPQKDRTPPNQVLEVEYTTLSQQRMPKTGEIQTSGTLRQGTSNGGAAIIPPGGVAAKAWHHQALELVRLISRRRFLLTRHSRVQFKSASKPEVKKNISFDSP